MTIKLKTTMSQILDIEFTLDNNILTAVDSTVKNMTLDAKEDYLQNYWTIEFIAHNNEKNIVGDPILKRVGVDSTFSSVSQFEFHDNGIYYYYKISIPSIDRFVGTEYSENLLGEVYFDDNGNLNQIIEVPESSEKQSILNVSETIDYIEAYNSITKNVDSSNEANESYFFPKKAIFSTYKIRECLIYLQRKLLFDVKEARCETSYKLRNHRDFLLNAMYVIDYLVEKGDFEEANSIVDKLSSSCECMCEDDLENFNNCDCGYTI